MVPSSAAAADAAVWAADWAAVLPKWYIAALMAAHAKVNSTGSSMVSATEAEPRSSRSVGSRGQWPPVMLASRPSMKPFMTPRTMPTRAI